MGCKSGLARLSPANHKLRLLRKNELQQPLHPDSQLLLRLAKCSQPPPLAKGGSHHHSHPHPSSLSAVAASRTRVAAAAAAATRFARWSHRRRWIDATTREKRLGKRKRKRRKKKGMEMGG
uniref:Uncharacterized protein n=1 Tax=Oryza meridionalis TaxID=40149 RepID=A0A0E0ERQ7_9ORYZ